MSDAIELRGLRVLAFCGVLPEEIARRQPFEIDVDVELDLTEAGATDDLEATIDYGGLVASIEDLVRDERFGLLERFASEVAALCLSNPRSAGVSVTVRKLRPPVASDLVSSGVTIRRTSP